MRVFEQVISSGSLERLGKAGRRGMVGAGRDIPEVVLMSRYGGVSREDRTLRLSIPWVLSSYWRV